MSIILYVYNIVFSQMHLVESAKLSDWEMTHSHLEHQGDLGKGQFGDVKLAYLKTITCTRRVRNYMDRMIKLGNSMSTLNVVAVKYLKGNYNSSLCYIVTTSCIHTHMLIVHPHVQGILCEVYFAQTRHGHAYSYFPHLVYMIPYACSVELFSYCKICPIIHDQ